MNPGLMRPATQVINTDSINRFPGIIHYLGSKISTFRLSLMCKRTHLRTPSPYSFALTVINPTL